MRVYFFASIRGRQKYEENYRLVVKALEKKGCVVDSDHIFNTTRESLLNQTLKERIHDHNKLQALMKNADLVAAELSCPSTSIGYELARALEWDKPLLALHFKGTDSPTILKGRTSDKLILQEYNLHDLNSIVEGAIDYFKRIGDMRFTLLLPEKLVRYLDWIHSHRKKPRSVFIREALLEKLSEDREFLEDKSELKKPLLLSRKTKAKG